MKKMIVIVFLFMVAGLAQAGPIDWCMDKLGYKPEIVVIQSDANAKISAAEASAAKAELVGIQRELAVEKTFNSKLSSLIDQAFTASFVAVFTMGLSIMLILWMGSSVIKRWTQSLANWRRDKSIEKGKKQGNLREFPKTEIDDVGVAI